MLMHAVLRSYVCHMRFRAIRPCLNVTNLTAIRPISNMEHSHIAAATEEIMKSAGDGKKKPDVSRMLKKESLEAFEKLYSSVPLQNRIDVLLFLAKKYGTDQNMISQQCQAFLDLQAVKRESSTLLRTEQKLSQLLKPSYCTLFSQLGSLESGVKFLLDLRYDAIRAAKECTLSRDDLHQLMHLSEHVRDILSIWFSVGLLELRRITWQTPALILEKLAEYEAVHAVRNWMDLKHRLGPNRRCYAFFHGSMPNEPVVVLHVALTEKISEDIGEILNYRVHKNGGDDVAEAKCAIFYSITSTQKGLTGIELGAYLIQSVVASLKAELPELTTFSSLSPIPGFRRWLLGELKEDRVLKYLDADDHHHITGAKKIIAHRGDVGSFFKQTLTNLEHLKNAEFATAVEKPFIKLCAKYICQMKRRSFALDSVANFHLKNGAVVWRINWMADRSSSGMQQSCGLMVNYRYHLEQMAENSMNYIVKQIIPVSGIIKPMLEHELPLSSNL